MKPDPARRHGSSPAELQARLHAERRWSALLVLRDGDGVQRIEPLDDRGPRVSIGRGGRADIRLPWDEQASRVHAELELVGGEWVLVDDGLSSNGSFVNGERVPTRRRLLDGDEVRIGETRLHYRRTAGADADAPTALPPDRASPVRVTEAQLRVLASLCRPLSEGDASASPASNRAIADELVLTVAAVKTHLRTLFAVFGIEDLPHNEKRRRLAERALATGTVRRR